MRRMICGVLMMMFLLPAAAVAADSVAKQWQEDARITEQMHDRHWVTCSTGDPGTLLIAAATLGLFLRRRR
jgi:MYXO-CTERM domain-containing protein